MKLQGQYRRSIAYRDGAVEILDQRLLPREIKWVQICTLEEAAMAIREMWVRGAPLIGAMAAYGFCFGLREGKTPQEAYDMLLATRPTAINLKWSLDQMMSAITPLLDAAGGAPATTSDRPGVQPSRRLSDYAIAKAAALCDEDAAIHEAIGTHGFALFKEIYAQKKRLNILTHCNAGWLACVDWGTALAPIYKAQEAGLKVMVYVDETRPRNQGALTALELREAGVPHKVIVDNAGGLLMQQGLIDLVIVGTDRTLKNGDVCNKIGTYLKALAAHDNGVPFYVALPYTTIDHSTEDSRKIEIEERSEKEVLELAGQPLYPEGTRALNPAFDITPARLVTGYITERGVLTHI